MSRFAIKLLLLSLALISFISFIMYTDLMRASEYKSIKSLEVGSEEVLLSVKKTETKKKLAYIVSDTRIPFWAIMERGVKRTATSLGYEIDVYSVENSRKNELESTVKAIKEHVAGIIISPTTSSACVTILKLAKNAGIPVVIADIGTDKGEYVSYISSNNKEGAYKIGKVLATKMLERGWGNGRVGIVAIPQKRFNGQLRTAGFMQAMQEMGIKGADIKQQSTWTEEETYRFSKDMIETYPDLRAIWLQGSDKYHGALRAIVDTGKKDQILLVTFDAEPEFLDLISQGLIIGSAMQQPYLMGEEAVYAMDNTLKGKKVEKNIELPILAISEENVAQKLPIIKRNVLGIKVKD